VDPFEDSGELETPLVQGVPHLLHVFVLEAFLSLDAFYYFVLGHDLVCYLGLCVHFRGGLGRRLTTFIRSIWVGDLGCRSCLWVADNEFKGAEQHDLRAPQVLKVKFLWHFLQREWVVEHLRLPVLEAHPRPVESQFL